MNLRVVAFIGIAVALAFSQASVNAPLSFEVASVKADDMSVTRVYRAYCEGGPGTRFPDQFICTDVTAANMALAALGLRPYQLPGTNTLDGPRYEVRAVIPRGATKEQVRIMFQNLLKDRFHFAWHFEKREMAVFELTQVEGGSRLRPSSGEGATAQNSGTPAANTGAALPPLRRGGVRSGSIYGVFHFEANGVPFSELVDYLSYRFGRKVIDHTGLTGDFNIVLYYRDQASVNPSVTPPKDAKFPPGYIVDPPDLAGALKEQLGIKLVSRKDNIDILVIDHFDKAPTPN